MYYIYHLGPTCFGIVTILKELTSRFHYNIQQYMIYSKRAFVLVSVIQEDGLNFVHLYFLNYTWYVNDLHNI